MTVVLMSAAELPRVETLAQVEHGRLPMRQAATVPGLSERQVFRPLRRFRADGAGGLASRRRGRLSNWRLPEAVRATAVAIVRTHDADSGPTLAAEKLAGGTRSRSRARRCASG